MNCVKSDVVGVNVEFVPYDTQNKFLAVLTELFILAFLGVSVESGLVEKDLSVLFFPLFLRLFGGIR